MTHDPRPKPHALPWIIIGAGRVGKTLGLAANRLQIPVAATWNRTKASAERTESLVDAQTYLSGASVGTAINELDSPDAIYWLTVPDDEIERVAADLVGTIPEDATVFHTSGYHSCTILTEAGLRENPVASVHPLQAIAEPTTAIEKLAEIKWALEGTSDAKSKARKILAQFDIDPFEIESSLKPLYHVAAVTASNFTVVLLEVAMRMAVKAGMERSEAKARLLPLMESTLENLAEDDPADALTGPVARGDEEMLDGHRRILDKKMPGPIRELYNLCTDLARDILGDKSD